MESIAEQAATLVALTLAGGTPLVFAALGELVTEKSGVLNLGVEGMMLVGAVVAFIVAASTHQPWLGALAGAAAGAATSAIFGVLTLSLMANQVATGLALSLFGVGLSAFIGKPYVSEMIAGIQPLSIPLLSDLPVLGKLVFAHSPLSICRCCCACWCTGFSIAPAPGCCCAPSGNRRRRRMPSAIRSSPSAISQSCSAAPVAGLGGAYMAVAYTPLWSEGMTAGRGWIALALVVFATWKPVRVLLGAYLFGGVTLVQFQAQAMGIAVPSQFLSMLPYLATIVVLALISRDATAIRLNAPASLGKPFHPDT